MTDLYAITPEERATYTAFSTTMWRQLVRPLPETLWYYTNASTFGRILKTGEVWSTQISCLNDHSEFRHAVRRLRDEIKNYVGHGDEHIRFLAQHLYETLEQDGADTSWFFVFCMSSVADDLSQWRALLISKANDGHSLRIGNQNCVPYATLRTNSRPPGFPVAKHVDHTSPVFRIRPNVEAFV